MIVRLMPSPSKNTCLLLLAMDTYSSYTPAVTYIKKYPSQAPALSGTAATASLMVVKSQLPSLLTTTKSLTLIISSPTRGSTGTFKTDTNGTVTVSLDTQPRVKRASETLCNLVSSFIVCDMSFLTFSAEGADSSPSRHVWRLVTTPLSQVWTSLACETGRA
ncbi:hypothetical protein TorRG33x02_236250 [Trema orientale]|uniref:Uncharacterized protein n=1 Tax=Trema orientale TaxID=63057 RepID=A0A2P5E1D1_TREOI|nr:hypothetical protein TorRG33x02_236250 [Trema orientale]